jgi:hypothetical protein
MRNTKGAYNPRVSRRIRILALLLSATTGIGCKSGRTADRDASSDLAPALTATAVEHLDHKAREPMVVEHPDGALFVAGYGEPDPTLSKSVDRGATWTRVAVGNASDGAIGNSDVDLAVARDGTLYFVVMAYDRKANEGRGVSVGVSQDGGARWHWTLLSQHRFDDRPWVEVSRRNGARHLERRQRCQLRHQ